MTRASRRPRMAGAAAALTCLLAVLGVLAVAPAGPAGAATLGRAGDPDYQRPVVGECHDYLRADVDKSTETSSPVRCSGRHTALVIAVVTPPAGVPLDGRPRHVAAVLRATARQCFTAENMTLGGHAAIRAESAYAYSYFVPTAAQLAQGARWVRCDLILLGGRALRPLPSPLLHSLTDATRRCLLRDGKQLLTTSCNRAHTYRSTKAVTLHAKRYPGLRFFQAAARRSCALPAGHGWYATWPEASTWNYGHHRQLVCYRQTTS